MTRARSLSLLANSNIFTVDQSNSRVGIGSTIPDVKLDVDGNMNVSGTLTYEDVTNVETAGITTTGGLVVTGLGATIGGITTFFGDLNFGAAGVGGTITTLGHAEFAGVVTATSFSGDGSGLTGVASTDNINTSTLAQFTGGVGIADSIFHIGDDNTAIRFPAADTFTVETAGSERVRVGSGGSVSIGKNNPITQLDIAAEPLNTATLTTTNCQRLGLLVTPNGTGSNTTGDIYTGVAVGDGYAGLYGVDAGSAAATSLAFFTGNNSSVAERLRITSGGDMGLGTATPTSFGPTFQVAGTDPALLLQDTATSVDYYGINIASGAVNTWFDDAAAFTINTASGISGSGLAERLRITSEGHIKHTGLRDGNSENKLVYYTVPSHDTGEEDVIVFTVANESSSNQITFGGGPSAYNAATEIVFRTASAVDTTTGSERLRIASSGQIGLGGANYGSAGQVITSNGSGSAPTWQDASGGISTQAGTASGIVTSLFLNDATDHKVTATGICTITTTQAGTEGQSHTIRIVNSGIATVGFSTYFLFPSGAAPVLPIADGAVSIISFTVHDSVGAGCTQLLAGASLNFS